MSERKATDWGAIERDYRAGILSLREIAAKDGNVTEGAIRKKAKGQGWTRDLSAKIKAKADDLVRKEEVRTQVRSETAANERQATGSLAHPNVPRRCRCSTRRFMRAQSWALASAIDR